MTTNSVDVGLVFAIKHRLSKHTLDEPMYLFPQVFPTALLDALGLPKGLPDSTRGSHRPVCALRVSWATCT